MSYEGDRKDTLKTLRKEGAPCFLVKPVPGVEPGYDEATDTNTTPSTEHAGFCVLTDFDENTVDGTLIQSGDVKILCLFEDKSLPVIGEDKIIVNPGTVNEVTYSVMPGSKSIMPDGKTCVLFKAQGRK